VDFTPRMFKLKSSKSGYVPSVVQPPDPTATAGPAAWKTLHTRRRLSPEWLRDVWVPTIPKSCGCQDGYEVYVKGNEPTFANEVADFIWGWRLHNAVNAKLVRQIVPLYDALQYWRPDLLHCTSRKERDVTIVTSLYSSNIETQLDAVRSWFASGFKVVSVNLEHEIADLKHVFPVEFQVGEATLAYHKLVPKASSLLKAKVRTNLKLVLNSDIKILRPIDEFLTKAPALGIRRNYFDTPMDDDIERWGIDAFLVSNDVCATFPDLDLGIGQPVWDYWVPWHLERLGLNLNWVGDPIFFHKRHPVRWDESSLQRGYDMIHAHYNDGEDWEMWRLNRPFHNAEQRSFILNRQNNRQI
jgi:hypothetical protein